MASVKINDLNLLKYCYERVSVGEMVTVPDIFPSDRCICFGEYYSDGEPIWSAVLCNFQKHDCLLELAMNIRGLFSRVLFERMARVVFDYAFNKAGLLRISTKVRLSNTPSLKITKGWGFEVEGIVKKGYAPPRVEDMVIFGLLKENCKWL